MGSSEAAKHPPEEALHFLCLGVDSSDIPSKNRTSKLLSKGTHTARAAGTVHPPKSAEEGRAELPPPSSSGPLGRAQSESSVLQSSPCTVSLLITMGRPPKWRTKRGMGMTEKEVGKNPRNTKPNSKLCSANQFFDQKIQNRENHKVQKLF